MKLLMTALTVAMSTVVWASEPVVAQPAPVTVPAPTADTAVILPPEAKEEIILNNPANLQALQTLLGPELMQAAANQGMQPASTGGAAPAGMPVNAAMAAGRQQVQVRPGETLDRILTRTLGRTPFAAALVRKTVVDMNPTAFAGGSPHRLTAGATLVLPSLQDLQAVAGGASPSTALRHSPLGGAAGHSHAADDRRNWIRYP
jgi:Tfp pilus assembly protein FimV